MAAHRRDARPLSEEDLDRLARRLENRPRRRPTDVERLRDHYQRVTHLVVCALTDPSAVKLLREISRSDRAEMFRSLGAIVAVASHIADAPDRRQRDALARKQRELARLYRLAAKHAKEHHAMFIEAPNGTGKVLITHDRTAPRPRPAASEPRLQRLTAERRCLHARLHAVFQQFTKHRGIKLHRLVAFVLSSVLGKPVAPESVAKAYPRIPPALRMFDDSERRRLLSAFGLTEQRRRVLPFRRATPPRTTTIPAR